jgi:hypothetical protein
LPTPVTAKERAAADAKRKQFAATIKASAGANAAAASADPAADAAADVAKVATTAPLKASSPNAAILPAAHFNSHKRILFDGRDESAVHRLRQVHVWSFV